MRDVDSVLRELDDEDRKRSRNRQRGNEKEPEFPWVFTSGFKEDDTFRVRFTNHPKLLPGGFHVYAVHKVVTAASESVEPQKVLCTESIAGKVDGKLVSPCYWCELSQYLLQDENWQFLDEELREVVRMMGGNRFFLHPVLINAEKAPPGSEHEWESTGPDGPVRGLLWAVGQDTMVKKIFKMYARHKDMDDPGVKGRWMEFTWSKPANYTLDALDPSPLTPDEIAFLDEKKYPPCKQYGRGKKNNKELSYARSRALAKETWWGKRLEREELASLE